jgi:glycosyltransferase involved in cell wall biosynthesis
MSFERANWLNNHLFDRFARRLVSECDVFHFVSSVGLHCAEKAKNLGATIICDVRQEHPAFQRKMLEEEANRFGLRPNVTGSTYERRVLEEFELADFIVVPSMHAKRTFVSEGFDPAKLFVLPYGVEVDLFGPMGRAPSTFRIIYAGALTLRKGVQYLLEAVASWQRSAAELILVGPIDPEFKPILARYEGKFTYLGVLPKLDLRELYATASVFVLPSLADSFSLATLEAMACGLPVIVSENTGAAEMVEDGKNGFVVPIRDAKTIRHKLEFLYDNQGCRLEMSRNALEQAQFSTWTQYGLKAVEFYRKLEAMRLDSDRRQFKVSHSSKICSNC